MKSNDCIQNRQKIHNNNRHCKSPEKREVILLNNKLYDLNNNLNDLFEKYKNIKKRRKIEEEKQKILNNKIQRLISKQIKINKKKNKNSLNKKFVNKNADIINENILDNIGYLSDINRSKNKKMEHNNSMKMMNDLELTNSNDLPRKINPTRKRHQSEKKLDINYDNELMNLSNYNARKLDERIKLINQDSKKPSFINNSNNFNRSYNNDSFKKEIFYNERIIKIINDGRQVKYSYNFNHKMENKSYINNFYKNKKKREISKNKDIYVLRREESKKHNNIKTNKDKDKDKEEYYFINDNNENINKNKKNAISVPNEKKINIEKNKTSQEETKKNFKELIQKGLINNKIASNKNLFTETLGKINERKRRINLKKNITLKSPENRNKLNSKKNKEYSNNYNNSFKHYTLLVKIQNKKPVKNEDKVNKKYLTMDNFYSFNKSKSNQNSEKEMVHCKTMDFPSKEDLMSLKNKNLSFSQIIENKRNILGLKLKNKEKRIVNEKYVKDFNLNEIKITEHIFPNSHNKNFIIIKKNHKSKDKSLEEEVKLIKVTKADNLIGEKSEDRRNFNNNKYMYNINSAKNIFSDDDRRKNISYKNLRKNKSKKKDNYYENISQKKKNMKKLDYFHTDKNILYNEGRPFNKAGRNKNIFSRKNI